MQEEGGGESLGGVSKFRGVRRLKNVALQLCRVSERMCVCVFVKCVFFLGCVCYHAPPVRVGPLFNRRSTVRTF